MDTLDLHPNMAPDNRAAPAIDPADRIEAAQEHADMAGSLLHAATLLLSDIVSTIGTGPLANIARRDLMHVANLLAALGDEQEHTRHAIEAALGAITAGEARA